MVLRVVSKETPVGLFFFSSLKYLFSNTTKTFSYHLSFPFTNESDAFTSSSSLTSGQQAPSITASAQVPPPPPPLPVCLSGSNRFSFSRAPVKSSGLVLTGIRFPLKVKGRGREGEGGWGGEGLCQWQQEGPHSAPHCVDLYKRPGAAGGRQ